VEDPFLRTQPTELLVHGELPVEAAEVAEDAVQVSAGEVAGERVHSGHADLVAPAVREGEAVALETTVRLEDDVSSGVIAQVERVRAVLVARRREADVADADALDLH
jgi:hypothetical protein